MMLQTALVLILATPKTLSFFPLRKCPTVCVLVSGSEIMFTVFKAIKDKKKAKKKRFNFVM